MASKKIILPDRKIIVPNQDLAPQDAGGSQWVSLFLQFMEHFQVPSKETGLGPLKLYGSQLRFLAELAEGLDNDIHLFFCLKALQLGISTVALAIDLFWLAVYPGMQGVIVTDTDGNRQKFRLLLKGFISQLPSDYAIKISKGGDNREHMIFTNGSVLDFIVAGTRSTATEVGRSRAYNFAHISELANFGAIEGIVSLIDRLAQTHPNRLYLMESTAKGFNLYYKLWHKAKQNPESQKAFFIGWWANETYSIAEDNPLFEKYWDGSITGEERTQIDNVWEMYGWRITPSQVVWYRWMEDSSADASLMPQNFPWTEHDAFLSTGQNFFPTKHSVGLVNKLTENPPPLLGWRYEFGAQFMETKIQSVDDADDAMLKIYEEPSELGWYAMGVDPAYGRSEWKDRSVIQVCRCYADRLVQVAEFATSDIQNFQVAWVMAHLAGIYKDVMMIVEITGPGDATILEVNHLKQLFDAGALPTPGNGEMKDIFGSARWFMYHRMDSPGAGYVYNWKGSLERNLAIMTELSDSLITGMLEVRSIQAALEMQSMVRRGFVIEPAMDDLKDDRVFGLAFCNRAWSQWIRPGMISNNETWEVMQKREAANEKGDHDNIVSNIVSAFFQGKEEEREQADIDSSWDE